MTRSKIAISLPKDQLARVHREIRAGRAQSVSGYIARVLAEHQVLRLEVAVQHALLMDVAEREHQLAEQLQRLFRSERAIGQAAVEVAAGEELPFKQAAVTSQGSAIELRINAEDPDNNFRGSPGTITKLRLPGGPGIRFDSHVYEGYTIVPYYDSLIGKLIVHRPTRAESLACMRRALDEFVIEGIKTTIPLAKKIFNHSAFIEGRVDTTFIERTWPFK